MTRARGTGQSCCGFGRGGWWGLLLAVWAVLSGPAHAIDCVVVVTDPECPALIHPAVATSVTTSTVYAEIEVMDGESFDVILRTNGQSPGTSVASYFTFKSELAGNKHRRHANIPIGLAPHDLSVVQYVAASPSQSWVLPPRTITRTTTPLIVELGQLTGTQAGTPGKVTTQTVGGAVQRTSPPDRVLVFGKTTLNGGTVHPATLALPTDATPLDGFPLPYFDEGGAGIESVLPLVVGEEEVQLTSPFVSGSTVYAFYWRINSTYGWRELGLAKMATGTPPFTRVTFSPAGGSFGDTYSMFRTGEILPAGHAVVSGSIVYLYGTYLPSGATTESALVARVALSSVESKASYEYWSEVGGVKAWRTGVTVSQLVPLWDNTGPPSVQWNASSSKWIAVHSIASGSVQPYGITEGHSILAVRSATALEGPWTPAAPVWQRPQTNVSGPGSAFRPTILPGLDSGQRIYVAANDGGNAGELTNARFYEIDLAAVVVPPVLTTPPASTSTNPYPVAGTAGPGDTVRVYVSGTLAGTGTANPTTGAFSIPVPVNDGAQPVYAEATRNGQTSAPSNTVTVNYVNATSRTYTSATISSNTVWTAGAAPGTTGPYVINGVLTVASGATLTLMPGVVVQFNVNSTPANDSITVNGTLRLQGTAASKVTLQRISGTARHNGILVPASGTAHLDHVVVEHAVRPLSVAGVALVSNTELRDFSIDGIYVYNAGSLTVTGNVTIDGLYNTSSKASNGINLSNTSGSGSIAGVTVRNAQVGIGSICTGHPVSNSTATLNTTGMTVKLGCSPLITGNLVTENGTGITVFGTAVTQSAQPTIRLNDIFANSTWNLFLSGGFLNPTTSAIDATDNWWGSTDPETVAATIKDHTDDTVLLSVNWRGFRAGSALQGSGPVLGSFLVGPTTGTIDASQPHTVIGDLIVAPGATLSIAPGATLKFLPGTRLLVQGTLLAVGTNTGLINFRSVEAAPAAGDWDGVIVDTQSTGSRLEYSIVEHTYRGIEVRTASAQIVDSIVRTYGRTFNGAVNAGIYLNDSASLVLRTTIENPSPAPGGYGILVDWAASSTKIPTLDRNTIRFASVGIRALGPGAVPRVGINIWSNTVEQNGNGIQLIGGVGDGTPSGAQVVGNFVRNNTSNGIWLTITTSDPAIDPLPVINGNDIHGNGAKDLSISAAYANAASTIVDATGNYWGTTSVAAIRAKITDYASNLTSAIANFANPLDNSILLNGQPITGNYIAGARPDGDTLVTGGVYEVISALTIPTGTTLHIQPGAVLKFHPGTELVVAGTLDASGGLFTSASATPAAGDWDGVRVNAGSTDVILQGVTVEYARRPIIVATGTSASIIGSTVRRWIYGYLSTTYGGIEFQSGSSGSVEGTTIDNFGAGGAGILVTSASPAITNNTIRNVGSGLRLSGCNSLITGNAIEGASDGIYLLSGSSPTISGGNVIRNNSQRGIRIDGAPSNPALDPKPVITGNQIYDNPSATSGYNVAITTAYGNSATVINAELNYWGTTNVTDIAARIRDKADVSTYATIDFDPFLDANGAPVGGGNILPASISTNTTLAAGSTWSLISNATVASGVTLTVDAGATVLASPGTKLTVNGTIVVNGTAANRAVFQSSEAVPTTGSWEGIWIASGGTGAISFADIRHGRHAVSIVDAVGTVTVEDTLFTDFGRTVGSVPGAAIRVKNSLVSLERNTLTHPLTPLLSHHGIHIEQALTGSLVSENSIRDVATALYIQQASPAVQGNTITFNSIGVDIRWGSSPAITAQNVIRDNYVGIQVTGNGSGASDPAPTIDGNDIFSNNEGSGAVLKNFVTASFGGVGELSTPNNYWGTTDPAVIAAGIVDRSDASGTTSPYVDFIPFLDASATASGAPVLGNFLAGAVIGSTTLSAGATYDLVGSVLVASGGSLTVPAGTTIRAVDGGSIDVKGTLTVQGTPANPAIFTSRAATPTRGIWDGIVIDSGSGSVIDNAQVRWADRGIWIKGVTANVTNTLIQDFDEIGIYVTNGGGTLSGNTIDNLDKLGTGIHVFESSPAIVGNTIQNTLVGIYINGTSNPTINGHNVITGNRIGIQLQAGSSTTAPPNPVVNDNDIFSNSWTPNDPRNLQLSGYYDPDNALIPKRLDFQRNWWGSTDPATILAGIEIIDPQAIAVDVSNFLTSPGGTPSTTPAFSIPLSNVRRSSQVFSPGRGESVTFLFDLYANATVTLKVFDEDDGTIATPIRTISGSYAAGNDRSFVWDGRDSSGDLVDEDAYGYALEVTDPIGSFTWNPSRPNVIQGQAGGGSSFDRGASIETFNTFQNDFWQRDVLASSNGARFDIRVTPTGSPAGFNIYTKKAVPPGANRVFWDGRDPAGQLVSGPVTILLIPDGIPLLWNNVIVENADPNVTGIAPQIEVKATPWFMVHSYGHLARISYHIDQESLVTVKMLPPGIADPNHASAILVSSAAQTPGDYTATWTGTLPGDVNSIRFAEEGAFTFTIQAVNQTSGRSTLYRGVLQMRR